MKLNRKRMLFAKTLTIGAQRLRRDPEFLAVARGIGELTLRELVLLAWFAGRQL
jgi:hypothetical protein